MATMGAACVAAWMAMLALLACGSPQRGSTAVVDELKSLDKPFNQELFLQLLNDYFSRRKPDNTMPPMPLPHVALSRMALSRCGRPVLGATDRC